MMFHYLGFTIERENLNQILGRNESPENIIADMVRSVQQWFTVSSAILEIQNEMLMKARMRKA